MEERGWPLEQAVAHMHGHGMPDLTAEMLRGWMRVAGRESVTQDPFAGERDEGRRAERMEEEIIKAAECVPGAAELMGLNRLRQEICGMEYEGANGNGGHGSEGSPQWEDAMSTRFFEVADKIGLTRTQLHTFIEEFLRGARSHYRLEGLTQTFDFVVRELREEIFEIRRGSIYIPKGGRWEMVDNGRPRVLESVIFVYGADGPLVDLKQRMRPRGKMYNCNRGQRLPVRFAAPSLAADIEGVTRRMFNVVAEFRASRHGRLSQLEMATACGVTKQAFSNQRRLFIGKVREATGARAGFAGVRNLRQ